MQDHNDIVSELSRIGLGDHEAGVFADLATHSPASAASVAKRLSLSRSTVYTALDRLIAKGLVGTSFRNEVKQFVAQPPSAVGDMLKREERDLRGRMEAFEKISAGLARLGDGNAAIPKITAFEGQESLKKIYLSMLREAPPHATMRILRDEFVWSPEWSFVFSDDWNGKVRRLRAERDVKTTLLVNDSPEERMHAKHYRSRKHFAYRVLSPADAMTDFALYVVGDTAALLSLAKGDLVGLKITNRHIAENMARLFDAVWKKAKSPRA